LAQPRVFTLLFSSAGAGVYKRERRRTTFDDTGRAVEFGAHVYRASRYSFEFQLLVRP
ncbi:GntR family transcriptional regulator, partial [Streptomyces alfalfae]